MGVGEPKLAAKRTVEEYCHPLRGFGRVAVVGGFPEWTGCVGFVIISKNPHPAMFLRLWNNSRLRQNSDDT